MAVLAGLMVGLAAGFGGGFYVGQQRVSISAPHAAAVPRPAPAESIPAEQAYTDAAVIEVAPQPAPVEPVLPVEPVSPVEPVPPVEPVSEGAPLRGATAAIAPVRSEAGSLVIASRPDNAQVFVDGRRAGVTPMSLNVQPGSHRVRIELTGHRRWETVVDVTGGTNVRVGASLTEN